MKESIAIIGGGIAGLTAAYLLNDKYDITLFEKDNRLGGNACTYKSSNGEDFDIAVAAFGKGGYKNFYKLLSELNIKTGMAPKAYMSMENLETKKGFYITPLSLKGLLTQKFDMFRPKHFKDLYNTYKGLKNGIKMMDDGKFDGLNMKEAVKLVPQLKGDSLLILMFTLCLLSSMNYSEVENSPAKFFFSKLKHHDDIISPRAIYSVRCVRNKTKSYIDALANTFKSSIVLNSKIKSVKRDNNEIILKMEDDDNKKFNKVIFACNADQALNLIEKPTDREKELLGAWKYKNGTIIVHTDGSSFPKRELCQSFTFLYTQKGDIVNTSVNGSLWYQPDVSNNCKYFSSQHPNFPIDKNLIEHQTIFRTPIFDEESMETIKDLPSLNNTLNSYYCGSHFGFGLHDDSVTSAIEIARMLGIKW